MTWEGAVPGVPEASVMRVTGLPARLAGARQVGPHSQARPGALLRVVPRVARYLVTGGNRIEVAVEEAAHPAEVLSFLLGGVRGALIHQRGELPLHAATVVPPDGSAAVSICGASGTGKSTLAAKLVQRGWSLLADDLTRITCTHSSVEAWPCSDGIKLTPDAIVRLGLRADSLEEVAAGKRWLPAATQAHPVSLGLILLLDRHPQASLRMLSGSAALATLTQQTFRLHYVAALGVIAEHLRIVSRVVAACRCIALSRHSGVESLADNLDCWRRAACRGSTPVAGTIAGPGGVLDELFGH